MNYRYIAYTPRNEIVRGTLGVISENVAVDTLERAGLKILSLKRARELSIEKLLPSLFRTSTRDVVLFSRQLAMLLERGVGFLAALRLARDQVASRALKKVLTAIVADVEAGSTFTRAIARHPQTFPLAYSRMMRVGEQSGKLEVVLKEVADHMEQDEATRKRVKTAMIYPGVIFGLGIVTVVVMVTVVLPPLTKVFEQFDTALPLPTRITLAVAGFFTDYKYFLLVGALVLALFLIWYSRTNAGRYNLERLVMRLPVAGHVSQLRNLAQFCRMVSILLRAGLPLIEVISVSRRSVQSEVLQRELGTIPDKLFQGQGLSRAMKAGKAFTPMLIQMVITGEETNTLDTSFTAIADHYEFEFDQSLNALISLLEPLLVLLVGLVVGFAAISAMMPIYSFYDVLA